MNTFASRVRKLSPRLAVVCLALAMVIGAFCLCSFPSSATTSYAQPYLDKLVEWGVMRGDLNGNLNPSRAVTRAEFVTMINRAYGYTEAGDNPFTDVTRSDWYYDDIRIAYKVGYFKGTSSSTASPNATLTREQAAVILARNMMLEENTGEVTDFSDSHDLSDWSRGLIESLVEEGVITGYSDGTFRPQDSITRGDVAIMLVRALGTPVQDEGTQSLGNVYGNVTITTSNVKLANTNIVGNLYITGGVDLGAVTLQNVTVSGKIIIAGGGESESADSSIVLRNTTAKELLVDSIIDKFVTLRAEGATNIPTTTVRSEAYVDDSSLTGYGLQQINVDADDGEEIHLAGENIKSVRNLTPNSTLVLGEGSIAQEITVDEKATNSTLTINNSATAQVVNLDTASTVNGDGNANEVNINAAGSTVTMLPDDVNIRPGITANVYGEEMNTVAGDESSSYPNITSALVKDKAPTSAQLVFQTNKKGTIYWTVSAKDEVIDLDDVISPPSYGGKILASGSIQVTASNTDFTAKVTGLTSGGSYRVTAVLVDNRNDRGPKTTGKIVKFETPDDTVPAFATGYPETTKLYKDGVQFTVMPNKTCTMYYALFPKGSTAPTTAEFKSNAVKNYSLWCGTMSLTKNTTATLSTKSSSTNAKGETVEKNIVTLEELVSYDMYFWLEDNDGAKSSTVQKVTFTTVDGTPPTVESIMQTSVKETTIEMTYALSEPGTLYWAVVKEGDDFIKKVDGESVGLASQEAKIQLENGMGAVKYGSSAASKGYTSIKFTISGLTKETTYDLYYVAKDKAGNYSEEIQVITVHTLDNSAPTATQEFTRYNGTDTTTPLANTDIRLIFSEGVQGNASKTCANWMTLSKTINNEDSTEEEVAASKATLLAELREHIKLYAESAYGGGSTDPVTERTAETAADDNDWIIDYRYATISTEDGKLVVTFPTDTTDGTKSALNLQSGATYYFVLTDIADNATPTPNKMGTTEMTHFTTVYAQIILTESDVTNIDPDFPTDDGRIDMSFQLQPRSTQSSTATDRWDLMLWSDTTVTFKLFYRELDSNRKAKTDWIEYKDKEGVTNQYATTASIAVSTGGNAPADDTDHTGYNATSLSATYDTVGNTITLGFLQDLQEDTIYEFGVQFVTVGVSGSSDYNSWSTKVTMKIGVAAGAYNQLRNLSGVVAQNWKSYKDGEKMHSIGLATYKKQTTDELTIEHQFTDSTAPRFDTGYPYLTKARSTSATVSVRLNRTDTTAYWVVAPQSGSGSISTLLQDGSAIVAADVNEMTGDKDPVTVTTPNYAQILDPSSLTTGVISGKISYSGAAKTISVEGLEPNTDYYMYFVLTGANSHSEVLVYKFKTTELEAPVIQMNLSSPKVTIEADENSTVYIALVEQNNLPSYFEDTKIECTITSSSGSTSKEEWSVIKAMTTPISEDDKRTYFDVYASDDIKDTVRLYITGTNTTLVDAGYLDATYRNNGTPLSLTAAVAKEIDFSESKYNMGTGMEQYYVLAAGRLTNNTKSYGFAAVSGLVNRDTEAPTSIMGETVLLDNFTYAKNANCTCEATDKCTYKTNPDHYTFSGTVTITFDKALYYIEQGSSGTSRKMLVMGTTDDETQKNIMDLLPSGSKNYFKANGTSTGQSTSFTFEVTGITHGYSITLPSSGQLANSSGYPTGKKLTLSFDARLPAEYGADIGLVTPGFHVSWK